MALSMSQISLPVFVRHLEGLAIVLKKAQALYTEKKFDDASLMNYRLYPDMFTFARQVQVACDTDGQAAKFQSGFATDEFYIAFV